ncbi:RluA family pseudouridine synthase [Paenibacillus sp. GCM10023252]|uniref:RluA family pseudouridine synthase n=1 Tax=Paenibacillus sp. GCM10023252 TaxID=3252649 RepID=UPI0036150AE5
MKNKSHGPSQGSNRSRPKRSGSAPAAAGRSTRIRKFTVSTSSELLAYLLEASTIGRNALKSMLARGQITVNDQVVKLYNHPLQPGQIIALHEGKPVETPPLAGMTIVHEDNDLIVINKDAGLLSIAGNGEDTQITAYRQLMAHVRAADPKSRIYVLHRLDRDTSGLMMFAKSEEVQQAMQNAWQETVRERTYVALVEGKVKREEGTITSWLKESKTLKMYSSHLPNDGQQAITHYKLLKANSAFSLLEIHLETGRKNQIRVHMEDIGHPIVGDKKYGARSKVIGRLGLHARVLAFLHPTSGELMRFETPIPKVFGNPLREQV